MQTYTVVYIGYPEFKHILRFVYQRRRLTIVNTAAAPGANIIQIYIRY